MLPQAKTKPLPRPGLKSNKVKPSQNNDDKGNKKDKSKSKSKPGITPTTKKKPKESTVLDIPPPPEESVPPTEESVPPTEESVTQQSDDDSSAFELDEKNLYLSINQARKVVVTVNKSKEEELEGLEFNSICPKKPRFVVIIQDLSLNDDNVEAKINKSKSKSKKRDKLPIAKMLKEQLLQNDIDSYIIGISGLFQDLRAAQVMKGCLIPEMESEMSAYNQLLLGIIQAKIKKKKRKVVILSLEKKANLGPDELKSFCETQCFAEVFTLDKVDDASFQQKLDKLIKKICRSRSGMGGPKYERAFEKIEGNADKSPTDDLDQNANVVLNSDDDTDNIGSALEMELKKFLVEIIPAASTPPKNDSAVDDQHSVLMTKEITQLPNPADEQVDQLTTIENGISNFDTNAPSFEETMIERGNGEDVQSPLELSIRGDNSSDQTSAFSNYTDDNNTNNGVCLLDGRTKARKKRRHLSTTQHPELDSRQSILKLLSKSSSKSKSDASSSDSEVSLHLSLIFASRPKLFKIRLTKDESIYPSAAFTRFPDITSVLSHHGHSNGNDLSEVNLYKGWIAVPTVDSTSSPINILKGPSSSAHSSIIRQQGDPQIPNNGLMTKLKSVVTKILRPIGNFLSCESCSNNQNHNPIRGGGPRPSRRRSHQVYPGIMMKYDGFDQTRDRLNNN